MEFKNINEVTQTKTSLDGTESFAGRDASGDFQTVKVGYNKEYLANGYRNYVIDGDFNNWHESTSISADGYGPDLWYCNFQGTTGTFSREDIIDSDVASYSGKIDITASPAANVYISQKLKDVSLIAGKNITIYIRAKSVSGVTSLLMEVDLFDGASSNTETTAAQAIPAGAVFNWYKFALTVSSASNLTITSGNFTEIKIKNTTSEIFDLDIDKVRVIETPENSLHYTPLWVQVEEDREAVRRLVKQYYFKTKGAAGIGGAIVAYGSAVSTTVADITIPVENEMIQTPTVTFTAVFLLQDITGGTTISITAPTTNNIVNTDKALFFKLNDSGAGLINNRAYSCPHSSIQFITVDARY